MKKLLFLIFLISSCNNKSSNKIDNGHVEKLAVNFMNEKVIPAMKDPKPFEITGAKVIYKTVADLVNEYRFTYAHLSLSREDSVENKNRLDSLIDVSKNLDSIISVTVNVGYNTRYKKGDVTTDSIKLKYNPETDKISYWPF